MFSPRYCLRIPLHQARLLGRRCGLPSAILLIVASGGIIINFLQSSVSAAKVSYGCIRSREGHRACIQRGLAGLAAPHPHLPRNVRYPPGAQAQDQPGGVHRAGCRDRRLRGLDRGRHRVLARGRWPVLLHSLYPSMVNMGGSISNFFVLQNAQGRTAALKCSAACRIHTTETL